LAFEKALCKKRVSSVEGGTEEKIVGEDGDEVIVLHSDQAKEEEEIK